MARVSKISIREAREIGPFCFRRIEIEVSVLKDDKLEDAKQFAADQLEDMFRTCEVKRPAREVIADIVNNEIPLDRQPF